MRKLDSKTRALIIRLLVEGNSIRATARIADVSKNTVNKLLIDAGKACSKFHDEYVRNVQASVIQCDEIWSFTYAKQKNVATATAAPSASRTRPRERRKGRRRPDRPCRAHPRAG